MEPQMNNTDPCLSVLLTCKSLSGGQGYFHREDANSAKKSDFKNFAFFASSRRIFWAALCSSVASSSCKLIRGIGIFSTDKTGLLPIELLTISSKNVNELLTSLDWPYCHSCS